MYKKVRKKPAAADASKKRREAAKKEEAAQKLAKQNVAKKNREAAKKEEAARKVAKQQVAKKNRDAKKALKKKLEQAKRLKNFYGSKYMMYDIRVPVNVAGINEFTIQLSRKDIYTNNFPKIRATLLGGDSPVIVRSAQGWMHWTLDGARLKQQFMNEKNKKRKEILTVMGEKFAAVFDQPG